MLMKVVRVGVMEMTCTVCGETTAFVYCPRCNGDEDDELPAWKYRRDLDEDGEVARQHRARLVPTVSYLHEWEYIICD